MGGVGLLVVFPMAYAIVMTALYLPVIVMLLALVFRGVAFEFREIGANKALWNLAFAGGSTIAGFAQGIVLGGMIQGIAVKDGAYAGGTFDWATPFAFLCGFGVSFGYALLGATWLTMKTTGPLADRARLGARLPAWPASRRGRRDRVVCLVCGGKANLRHARALRPWRNRRRGRA